jgi:hypothetical protein
MYAFRPDVFYPEDLTRNIYSTKRVFRFYAPLLLL